MSNNWVQDDVMWCLPEKQKDGNKATERPLSPIFLTIPTALSKPLLTSRIDVSAWTGTIVDVAPPGYVEGIPRWLNHGVLGGDWALVFQCPFVLVARDR